MSSSVATEGPATTGGPPPSDGGPRSPRRPRPIFLLVGLVLAGILAVILFVGIGTTPGTTSFGTGSPVPTFSLARVGGSGTVGVPANGGGGGQAAILLFFASWCAPCHKEIPALSAVYASQRRDHSPLTKVSVVGIDVQDPADNAEAFLASSKVTFPVGADTNYAVSGGEFASPGLPESVFVSANGTIEGIHYGALSSATFTKWEKKLLAS